MSHEGIQPEARPGGTAIQGPVLEVPMVLGHAIDVTPIPHASDAFLGDSSVNRSLPLWRKAAIAGTAFVAGVTAAGVAPKPAEANGFLLAGGTQSSECIDDGGVYVFKREPGIAVVDPNTQIASVAQPGTGEITTADQESEQEEIFIASLPDGSRLIAVIAEACATASPAPTETPKPTPTDLIKPRKHDVNDIINAPSDSNVTTEELDKLLKKAYPKVDTHPQATNKVLAKKDAVELLKECENGNPILCQAALGALIDIYLMTGDVDYYNFAVSLKNYMVDKFGAEDVLNQSLKDSFPDRKTPREY